MRKKLTLVGVLSALTLGIVSLTGGGTSSAAPVQNFSVDQSICYGSSPVVGSLSCPGTSATVAPSGSSANTYQSIKLDIGSRLTLPTTYTPSSYGFTVPAQGAVTGDVTSRTDLLCDGGLDILAGGPDIATPWNYYDYAGPIGGNGDPAAYGGGVAGDTWPDSAGKWAPYDFVHQNVAPAGQDAYLSSIKPMPSTFTPVSHDRALLFTLTLSSGTALFLPLIQNGQPTPLNTVTESSPYTAGLRVSVTLLAGSPAPPSNSFLTCLDSPQDSLARNNQITTPGATGLAPRWTMYTSAADARDGTVSRLIDVSCLQVNGPLTDTDNDCIEGGAGDLAGADSDADFLVDGVEAAFGTNPALAGATDGDADGATDFDEMAQFTNPNNPDTDADGSKDKQDNGSDETPGGAVNDTTNDDNCPADANPTQDNADYANDYNGVTGDPTNNSQDSLGDACDTDDDNDRMDDVAEGGLYIAPGAAPAGGFCKPDASAGGGPNVLSPSGSTDPDSDDDLGLDGAECKFDSNPKDFASKMATQPNDNLGPTGTEDQQETFYRTQKINKPGGGQEDNPDNDVPANTGVTDNDSDNDKLLDGAEVKFYGTHPTNPDTDKDGCPDGAEAATVNGDRSVGAIDLSQVAQRFGGYTPANEGAAVPAGRVDYDYTKDRTIGSSDLSQIAQQFQACPDQGGLTINRGNVSPMP